MVKAGLLASTNSLRKRGISEEENIQTEFSRKKILNATNTIISSNFHDLVNP